MFLFVFLVPSCPCVIVFIFLIFQGGSLFLFNYNKLGRLSNAILPTGEVLHLSSEISVDNDHLDLAMSSPRHPPPQISGNDEKKPFSLDVRTSNNDFKKYSLVKGNFAVLSENLSLCPQPLSNSEPKVGSY